MSLLSVIGVYNIGYKHTTGVKDTMSLTPLTILSLFLFPLLCLWIEKQIDNYREYKFKKLKNTNAGSLMLKHYESRPIRPISDNELYSAYRKSRHIVEGKPKDYFDWLDRWISQGGEVTHDHSYLTKRLPESNLTGLDRFRRCSVHVIRKSIDPLKLGGSQSLMLVARKGVFVKPGDYGHNEVYGYNERGDAVV